MATVSGLINTGTTTLNSTTTVKGPIYFGSAVGSEAYKPILAYSETYPQYGICYNNSSVDKMSFSASGNAGSAAADLCINGNGNGTVTIRGNNIWHAGNLTKVSQLTNDSGYLTSLPDHNHHDYYMRVIEQNSTFTLETIPVNLAPGVHKIHISGKEYSSILCGNDYTGAQWQLYFHPHASYDQSIKYRYRDGAWRTILDSANSSVSKEGETLTVTINGTSQSLTNSTYNFSGVSFTSGQSDTGDHNCNNIKTNGHWYYTSNGPDTSLGATTSDGALYTQAYSTSWVTQIAQDYRNGNLYTRSHKGDNSNNIPAGWQPWRKVAYADDAMTPKSHTHPKSDITDFPTTLPADGGAADTLKTPRTIGLGTAVTSTATSFNGSANITIPVTGVKEAYLSWGGQNHVGSYGPIDAAMVPLLGANRLAFVSPDKVLVEYSTDGGSTWSTYSVTNAQKSNLFNGIGGANLYIGGSSASKIDKSKYMVRVTLSTSGADVYSVLNKFVIYVSTAGSSGSYCSIDARLQSNVASNTNTWVNFVNKQSISGWSGYNVINTAGITTFGNTATSQYGQVRFTFGVTSHTSSVTYPGLTVLSILAYGGVGWSTPSNLAKYGTIYSYDWEQNVTFPKNVTATTFIGSLQGNCTGSSGSCTGNAGTATALANARTLTIGNTGKTFDGSADVAWSLAEIGAASSGHTHSFTDITPGTATIGDGANAIYLRTSSSWASTIYHQTSADEAVVFLNKGKDVNSTANYTTSWIFAYGTPSERPVWSTLTPALQIKGACVAINKLIGSKVGGSYNLDVNGSANATELYENGTRVLTTSGTALNTYYIRTQQQNSTNFYTGYRAWLKWIDGSTLGMKITSADTATDTTASTWQFRADQASKLVINEGSTDKDFYLTLCREVSNVKSVHYVSDLHYDSSILYCPYFDGTLIGNAASATTASKLSTVSKTAWGQTYWTSGGIPTNISGSISSAYFQIVDRASNPYFQLIENGKNAYFQIASGVIYVGSTSAKSLGITQDGAVTVPSTFSAVGNISSSGTISAASGFYQTSDERLKHFIKDVEIDFDKLKQIPKKYFNWKGQNTNQLCIGTSAQAIQKLYPELVSKDSSGQMSVAYDKLSVIALKGIDELYQLILQLKKENEDLKEIINSIKR